MQKVFAGSVVGPVALDPNRLAQQSQDGVYPLEGTPGGEGQRGLWGPRFGIRGICILLYRGNHGVKVQANVALCRRVVLPGGAL
jgi:hypothetical protein